MKKLNLVSLAIKSALMLATVSVSQNSIAEINNEKIERISVTGSKIKRIGITSPTPVIVISSEDLAQAGVTNINDLLAELPSGEVGLSPDSTNGYIYANGLNTYNLRGLGSERTLVLVDGKRFIGAGPTNPAVDLNNIPASMIERVEVITGGASAVYGADAVAGVVNIITKKSHQGISVQLDTSKPQQTGGEKHAISLVGGFEFSGFNFVTSVEYTKNEALKKMDRDFFRTPVESHFNPANTTNSDLIPRRISHNFGEGYGLYASQGNFVLGSTRDGWALDNRNYTFDPDGSIRLFDYGLGRLYDHPSENASVYYASNGDNLGDGIPHGGTNQYQYFNSPLERANFATSLSYDISQDHEFTSSIYYTQSKGTGLSSPTFYQHSITTDNAFMSDEMKNLLANNTNEAGEADAKESITLFQMTPVFGNREYEQNREALNFNFGFNGAINDNWNYDLYAQYGSNENNSKWFGEVFEQNIANAVDAVELNGNIVCADRNNDGEVIGAISGCTPLNVMNLQSLTQAQSDYLVTVARNDRSSKMSAYGATVDGVLYELPAGDIAAAFSVEYRKNTAKTRPSEDMQNGTIFGNSSDPMDGEMSVKEVSAEFSVPLLADSEWGKSLTLDTAIRYMDYSVTGSDNAWKLGLNYEVNDELKFRATRSKSVRAPTLGELFNTRSVTYGTRTDPCTAVNLAARDIKAAQVKAVCEAQGVPTDFRPSDQWLDGGSIIGYVEGNTELKNETSNDYTFGIVYSPKSVEGLDMTLDYWTFEIEGALETFGDESINLCYESGDPDSPFCANVNRNKTTNEIDNFYERPLNAAVWNRSGIDFDAKYKFDVQGGIVSFGFVGTYNLEADYNATGEADAVEVQLGEYNDDHNYTRIKTRLTARYQAEGYFIGAIVNYRHGTKRDLDGTIETSNYNDIASYTRADVQAGFDISEDFVLTARIRNVFDKAPTRNPYTFDDGQYFDVYGRTLALTAKYNF
ncbi:TonB-dependent receptor domain-containing protein [Pseudoalteromonas denitrificans]|uniref:Outer membrane receptor for ferrienterochelin and colicins n=1 Tax=Pseudoalteromonas denitrificans DSM 6059 TaxID=1123010 RepID=A0A1I1EDM0_9GAMM|nr:TonB-dependent receptor [Pseudoalteromonas denitrificans]SFB83428.1 Outer membrane receptor for ferrienterochelin and colicins [Pseudoalteromonas denitrificans DSM 6059]